MKSTKTKTITRRLILPICLAVLIMLLVFRNGFAVHAYDDGRWVGKIGFMSVVMFYIEDSQLAILRLVAQNACNARADGMYSEYYVNLGKGALGSAPQFYVEANGHIDGGFTVDSGVYKGLEIQLKGDLNNKTGRLVVTLSSHNDLEVCAKASIFNVQWTTSRNL